MKFSSPPDRAVQEKSNRVDDSRNGIIVRFTCTTSYLIYIVLKEATLSSNTCMNSCLLQIRGVEAGYKWNLFPEHTGPLYLRTPTVGSIPAARLGRSTVAKGKHTVCFW